MSEAGFGYKFAGKCYCVNWTQDDRVDNEERHRLLEVVQVSLWEESRIA